MVVFNSEHKVNLYSPCHCKSTGVYRGGIHCTHNETTYIIQQRYRCVCVCVSTRHCVYACLTNPFMLLSTEIGPASVMVGNLVSGKRIAQASGRDLGQIEDNDQARKVCVRLSEGLVFICTPSIRTFTRPICLHPTIPSHVTSSNGGFEFDHSSTSFTFLSFFAIVSTAEIGRASCRERV